MSSNPSRYHQTKPEAINELLALVDARDKKSTDVCVRNAQRRWRSLIQGHSSRDWKPIELFQVTIVKLLEFSSLTAWDRNRLFLACDIWLRLVWQWHPPHRQHRVTMTTIMSATDQDQES